MVENETKQKILETASVLASNCFGNNLLLSFIGGSCAKGAPKKNSDVDSFVVLKQPDRQKEAAYFNHFRQLHAANQLDFTHCGEIFDKNTLEDLISYTIDILGTLPDVQHAGCYYWDCIFSVFRKGAVVLNLLKEPKVFVCGDKEYLSNLEKRAIKFTQDFPIPYMHLEKEQSTIAPPSIIAIGNQILREADLQGTPVGIGLERWFRRPFGVFCSDLVSSSEEKDEVHMMKEGAIAKRGCPLELNFADTRKGMLLRQQCLAINRPVAVSNG